MNKKKPNCLFCNIPDTSVVRQNSLAFVIMDNYPVTSLHSLIIPKRHAENYFELTKAELISLHELIHLSRKMIQREDKTVDGFNIGINVGKTAGQSIFHCHIHLIPRRKGDVENPKGGVRHLIPGKGYY